MSERDPWTDSSGKGISYPCLVFFFFFFFFFQEGDDCEDKIGEDEEGARLTKSFLWAKKGTGQFRGSQLLSMRGGGGEEKS